MQNSGIPPCHYRISVKALILNEQEKFLLCKEDNGLWELPGGGVNYGEDLRECLKREIHEEMGLEITSIADQPSYFFTSTSLRKMNIANALYETTVKNFDFTPSEECMEIGFFTLEEASKLPTFPNIQAFLRVYKSKNHVHH